MQGTVEYVDKNLEINKNLSIVIIFVRFHRTKPEIPLLLASWNFICCITYVIWLFLQTFSQEIWLTWRKNLCFIH